MLIFRSGDPPPAGAAVPSDSAGGTRLGALRRVHANAPGASPRHPPTPGPRVLLPPGTNPATAVPGLKFEATWGRSPPPARVVPTQPKTKTRRPRPPTANRAGVVGTLARGAPTSASAPERPVGERAEVRPRDAAMRGPKTGLDPSETRTRCRGGGVLPEYRGAAPAGRYARHWAARYSGGLRFRKRCCLPSPGKFPNRCGCGDQRLGGYDAGSSAQVQESRDASSQDQSSARSL